MMKISLQTPSGPHSMVTGSPHPLHRKRGGLRKVAEGAGRAERQRGGKKEGALNMEIYVPTVT